MQNKIFIHANTYSWVPEGIPWKKRQTLHCMFLSLQFICSVYPNNTVTHTIVTAWLLTKQNQRVIFRDLVMMSNSTFYTEELLTCKPYQTLNS